MYYGASRIMYESCSIQHPNSALLWSSVKLLQNLRNGLDSGNRCSAAKTMDVYRIHLYHLPSHLLQEDNGGMLHIWNPPPIHLPVSWISYSTHEQNALGIATPVQWRQVTQLCQVVGILDLLISWIYLIDFQIARIGWPKRWRSSGREYGSLPLVSLSWARSLPRTLQPK